MRNPVATQNINNIPPVIADTQAFFVCYCCCRAYFVDQLRDTFLLKLPEQLTSKLGKKQT